jgi:hypothetical protein
MHGMISIKFIIRNYCFSTATIVTGTHLDVTLDVRCRSFSHVLLIVIVLFAHSESAFAYDKRRQASYPYFMEHGCLSAKLHAITSPGLQSWWDSVLCLLSQMCPVCVLTHRSFRIHRNSIILVSSGSCPLSLYEFLTPATHAHSLWLVVCGLNNWGSVLIQHTVTS